MADEEPSTPAKSNFGPSLEEICKDEEINDTRNLYVLSSIKRGKWWDFIDSLNSDGEYPIIPVFEGVQRRLLGIFRVEMRRVKAIYDENNQYFELWDYNAPILNVMRECLQELRKISCGSSDNIKKAPYLYGYLTENEESSMLRGQFKNAQAFRLAKQALFTTPKED